MDKLYFDEMDRDLTLWENTKAFFSIPEYEPFIARIPLTNSISTQLYDTYVSHLLKHPKDIWVGNDDYMGICFNYHPFVPRNMLSQYSDYYTTDDKRLSYESSLIFTQYTKAGTYFKGLFDPFPFVRSKLARLKGGIAFNGDWHRDEDPREVLKVVIPMRTGTSFKFQIQGHEPITPIVGEAIVFDASIPHRVISDGSDDTHRDYLIFNVPIWLLVDDDMNISKTEFFGCPLVHCLYENCNIFEK